MRAILVALAALWLAMPAILAWAGSWAAAATVFVVQLMVLCTLVSRQVPTRDRSRDDPGTVAQDRPRNCR